MNENLVMIRFVELKLEIRVIIRDFEFMEDNYMMSYYELGGF